MKPLTNRALGVTGDSNTVPMTVRVPKEVAVFIDSHLTEQIKNRSEFLQHWLQIAVRVGQDEELAEALDWALDRNVLEKDPWNWRDYYTDVTLTTETLLQGPPKPVEFPPLSMDDRIEGTELVDLQESQLEALRNRVR